MTFQHFFNSIKSIEEGCKGFVVSFLSLSHSTFINSILNIWINPLYCIINLFLQIFWVNIIKLLSRKSIKILIKHFNDFTAFVIYNLLSFFVPKNRDSDFIFIIGRCFFINLIHTLKAIKRIFTVFSNNLTFVIFIENPSKSSFIIYNTPFRFNKRYRNNIL